jgi:hypothetical protein
MARRTAEMARESALRTLRDHHSAGRHHPSVGGRPKRLEFRVSIRGKRHIGSSAEEIVGNQTYESAQLNHAERSMRMSPISQICLYCVSDGVPRRSFVVALIVGAILNLINQGDALFGQGHLNLTKIVLTFVVPYCVATYGAVSFRMSGKRTHCDPVSGE